jgi:biopolymer transport protein ExbD
MARHIEPEEEPEVEMTPMLDVVFILLIFFIVTATFVKTPGADVEKVEIKNSSAIKSPIMVALTDKDEIWVNRKSIEMREVYAVMQDMVEDNPGGEAMIQVDGSSSYGILRELKETMVNAGVKKINISTEPNN